MSDDQPHVHRYVTSYLAQNGRNRNLYWDEKAEAWPYPVKAHFDDPDTQIDVNKCAKMLPLVVPGLKVVKSELRKPGKFDRGSYGIVWFTWGREAMWERFEELWNEYGVADERLAFMDCSGIDTWKKQTSLPGVVHPTPYSTGFTVADRMFWSSYTPYGLNVIESAFCNRIQFPNCGGPEARGSESLRCRIGDEWWLVGSRGDAVEVMTLEVDGSPLSQEVKDNLILNLGFR